MELKARIWGIGGLLTVGLLVAAIGIIDDKPTTTTENSQAEAGASPAESAAAAPAPEPVGAPEQTQAAVEFDPEVEALSDLEIELRMAGLPNPGDHIEFGKHLDGLGWGVSPAKSKEYAKYDWETLESMAEAGDFIALSALDRKIGSTDPIDYERLAEVREKAAMFGMTVSAIMHGKRLLGEYALLLEYPDMDESQAYKDGDPRKRVVDGLAWLDFSVTRGDLEAAKDMAAAVADPRLAITEGELQAAKVEAQRIYQRLSEQRAARGLPEFENYIPPGAIRNYEHTLKMPSSMVRHQGE